MLMPRSDLGLRSTTTSDTRDLSLKRAAPAVAGHDLKGDPFAAQISTDSELSSPMSIESIAQGHPALQDVLRENKLVHDVYLRLTELLREGSGGSVRGSPEVFQEIMRLKEIMDAADRREQLCGPAAEFRAPLPRCAPPMKAFPPPAETLGRRPSPAPSRQAGALQGPRAPTKRPRTIAPVPLYDAEGPPLCAQGPSKRDQEGRARPVAGAITSVSVKKTCDRLPPRRMSADCGLDDDELAVASTLVAMRSLPKTAGTLR